MVSQKLLTNIMGETISDDLDTAPGGFLKFSDNGDILSVNTTLTVMLGHESKSDLIGQNLHTIVNIAGRIFLQTHFLPLLILKGRADEIFLQLKTKDGNQIPVIINALRKAPNGVAVNHCVVFPATQRSKYEQELLDARRRAEDIGLQNAELSRSKLQLEEHTYLLDQRLSELRTIGEDLIQFGKLMSHDVQEPIRKIAVYTDRIANKYSKELGEDVVAQFRIIHQQCAKFRSVTANLEQFISLNLHTVQFEEINLNQSMNAALQIAMEAEDFHEVDFSSSDLPHIFGYRDEIDMLFYHLLKNCIKYREPSRSLEIRIEHNSYSKNSYQFLKGRHRYNEYIRIVLTDNGIGFPPGAEENYFKIKKKDNAENRFLSFGLAFCKKVVDNHFGTITIDSTPGEGTSIAISFPQKL